ncbi:MAG: methylenetetrahydrofolate reductase [Deltaproteobacteria bacterium]|nr:methylenetetrahydrofolate reductase [Deltaproteobacteria bacterium]HDM08888.1 5,10-methylenetetrahydrofolate reductase [Desulfobacteraceae bacterium]
MTFREKLEQKKFAVLAEFEPPKGADFSEMLTNAINVKGRIDAFVVPEMATAVMKASSLGGCLSLQINGLETVFQVCCRDRNRLALQADILSAAALGIPNLMVVKGDDITVGDHPQARAVNDIDVFELLEAVDQMQNGKDMAGIELKGAPDFFVGALFNAGAQGGLFDLELEELEKKINLGVKFVITNPVFDLKILERVLKRLDKDQVALIPKVLLLKSAGMARYINRNMKNISIPENLIKSIQKAPDKARECIKIAAEIIKQIKNMELPGVAISTMGWEDKLPQILDESNIV